MQVNFKRWGLHVFSSTTEAPNFSFVKKRNLKCKADRTAVKRYILLRPIFRIDKTILHQGHKMLRLLAFYAPDEG